MIVPGHELTEVVDENEAIAIYRGIARENGASVLAITTRDEHPDTDAAAEWRRSYEAMRLLDEEGAPAAMALETVDGRPLLLVRDDGSIPARRLIRPGLPPSDPAELTRLVEIAVKAADSLARIHRRGFSHLAVTSMTLLVHPETLEIRFIGFGRTMHASLHASQATEAALSAWELPYMAPESSGRTNASPDERADLYGFGILLYEWLTGRLPYAAESRPELIYAHIAGDAPPAMELNRSLPKPLSDIVRKCMNKDPKERYRSASGVRADLLECLDQLRRTNTVAPFEPGRRDRYALWETSTSGLYGREAELRQLEALLNREPDDWPKLLLIGGESGVGKTALARTFLHQRADTICAAWGKFDPPPSDLPFAGWIQVLEALVHRLLSGDELRLEYWKQSLRKALGDYGQLLVRRAPKLELLIGPQPAIRPLPPLEEKSRFQHAFGLFLQLCADELQPVVIFLDDLQWADEASLQLADRLLRDSRLGSLTMIGAYREGEPTNSVWNRWAEQTVHGRPPSARMRLEPLDQATVERMLSQRLPGQAEKLGDIASLLMLRTSGNPLLIRQILQQATERGWAVFNEKAASWEWNLDKLTGADASENLPPVRADLSGIRLLRPQPLRRLLIWAALLGRQFRLSELLELDGTPRDEATAALREAVRCGWLARVGAGDSAEEGDERYVFAHDRVRQEFQALAPEAEKPGYHYAIGSLWRRRMQSPGTEDPFLLPAVNHLNRALSLMEDAKERQELAWLNGDAGAKASSSAAYEQGLVYYRQAAELLGDDGWTKQAPLTFDIWKKWAICEYLCDRVEEANRLFAELLRRAKSDLERTEIYTERIRLESERGHYRNAVKLARQALEGLGVSLTAWKGTWPLLMQGLRVGWKLRGARRQAPAQGRTMTDARLRAAMSVLVHAGHAQFMQDKREWASANLTLLELTIRHGAAPESAVGYAAMALMESMLRKRHRVAYEWGKLAMEQARSQPQLRTVVSNAFLLCHESWNQFEPGLLDEWFREADRARFESDSLWQADQLVLVVSGLMIQLGRPLPEAYGLLQRHAHSIDRRPSAEHVKYCAVLEAILHGLMSGDEFTPKLFPEVRPNDPSFILDREGDPDKRLEESLRFIDYLTAYFREDYGSAYENIERLEKLLHRRKNSENDWSAHSFYAVLVLFHRHASAPAAERTSLVRSARRHLVRLKKAANRCPANYGPVYDLAEAAFLQMKGRTKQAEKRFVIACERNREAGFLHNYGIACELTALLYRERAKPHLARSFMTEAYRAYSQWGARRKAALLLEAHRHLILDGDSAARGEFDYRSAMNSIQAISEEMRLDRLLPRLMQIVIRNAGAQRGALVLEKEGSFYVEARATAQEMSLERVALADANDLPSAIIGYVARTREDAMLDDASREGLFANHPDIRRRGLKSVLCLPLAKGNRLIGVLYLENNLSTGVFTPERIHLMKLLCSQCAISIENAHLYANVEQMRKTLEERVELRTRALEEAMQETASALAEASVQSDRNRIAADVHDIMGHTITSSLLQLEAAKLQLHKDTEDAENRLRSVQQLLKQGLQEIRESIQMLRNGKKEDTEHEWRQWIEHLESSSGIRVEARIGALPELGANGWHALRHALREGITNGIRHGGADRFRFSLLAADGQLRFRLSDNGARPSSELVPGFGLTAMQERIAAHGGRLSLKPSEDGGCELRIDVPYLNEEERSPHGQA